MSRKAKGAGDDLERELARAMRKANRRGRKGRGAQNQSPLFGG